MNQTLRIIDERASLRQYDDKRPIGTAAVEAILHSAMRAPTAGNMMLYTILQIDDPDAKQRLAETCGHPFIANAPLVLLFLADLQRWVDFFEANDVPAHCEATETAYRTPGAEKLLMACCDALIAAQSSVLAAESLGIGSCYVGDILGHAEVHRGLFELPPFAFPITLLCFGHPVAGRERRRSDRFDRRFVHHVDRYRRFSADDLRKMLSEIEAKFASVLRKRGESLAQLTYGGFMMGKAALEGERSVSLLLEPWLEPSVR